MKQHITIEQLKELNLESRNRLLINADAWNEYKLEHGVFSEHEICSQISIGKMIEILEQNNIIFGITNAVVWFGNPSCRGIELNLLNKQKKYSALELADCLWEAIKTIL